MTHDRHVLTGVAESKSARFSVFFSSFVLVENLIQVAPVSIFMRNSRRPTSVNRRKTNYRHNNRRSEKVSAAIKINKLIRVDLSENS